MMAALALECLFLVTTRRYFTLCRLRAFNDDRSAGKITSLSEGLDKLSMVVFTNLSDTVSERSVSLSSLLSATSESPGRFGRNKPEATMNASPIVSTFHK